MRKTLEAVSLFTLAVLFWITWSALFGPDRLPERIPTHFDISGTPNSWGSPSTLWLLPIIAASTYLIMSVVARIPTAYRYPVRVTAINLPSLQKQTASMVLFLKTELVCLFTWVQWSIIQSARSSQFRMSPLLIPLFLIIVFCTTAWHFVAILRAANAPQDSEQGSQNRSM